MSYEIGHVEKRACENREGEKISGREKTGCGHWHHCDQPPCQKKSQARQPRLVPSHNDTAAATKPRITDLDNSPQLRQTNYISSPVGAILAAVDFTSATDIMLLRKKKSKVAPHPMFYCF